MSLNDVGMEHFRPDEFGEWWGYVDPKLLMMLDEFRERIGKKVIISPADGALGRHLGQDNKSRHNVDRWGVVMAADIMLPEGPVVGQEIDSRYLICVAESVGFGGIGMYPEWKPHPGMHLDSRPRTDGRVATWSRIGGEYVGIERAWA